MKASEALKKAKEGKENEEILNAIISNSDYTIKYLKYLAAQDKEIPMMVWNATLASPKIALMYSKLCMEKHIDIPWEIVESILNNIVCAKTYVKLSAKHNYEISDNVLSYLYNEDDTFIANFARILYQDKILDKYPSVNFLLLNDVELARDFVFGLILSHEDIPKEYINKIKEDDQVNLELILELISLDIDIESPICQALVEEFVKYKDANNCNIIAIELIEKGLVVPYDIENVIIHDDDFVVDYCLKLKFENREIPQEASEIMSNDVTLYNAFASGLKKMINSVTSNTTHTETQPAEQSSEQEVEKYIYGTIYCDASKLDVFIKVIRNMGSFCGLDVTNPEIDFVMTREQLENIAKMDGFIKVTIENS